MTDEKKLKPCPFCGSDKLNEFIQGEFSQHGSRQHLMIECTECHVFNQKEAWNTRPSAGVSVEAIEKIIHLRTFEHRNEDGKFGISYIKGCGYCNDRPWLRSIAESIYAMIKGEA